jgi:putative peptidoglycan lipid II flippase
MRFLKQSLVAASIITIAANLISRVFGYAREATIANYFGTGSALDIFLIAFTIPELVFSIGYSSIPTALIPALKKVREKIELNDTSLYFTGFVIFALLFGSLALATFFLKGTIFRLLAPDFPDSQYAMGVKLLSIVAFCIFFSGMEVYFRSWQFEKKHFIIPTSSGIILNIVILVALVTLYGSQNINALALGWLFGSTTLFLYNGLSATRIVGWKGSITFNFSWASLLLKSVVFVIIIQSIPFFYIVVDRYLAANYLDAGHISALKFALVLYQLPIGIFIWAINVAAFPWISDYSSSENSRKLSDLYHDSVRLIIFVIGFTSAGIILFSNEIVAIAFLRGEFNIVSLELTSEPLRYYSIGALFYSIYIFQMRFYYARRALFRLGVILLSSLAIKIIFSLLLIGPMDHNGLALAMVLSWSFGFGFMTIDMNRFLKTRWSDLLSGTPAKIMLNILIVAAFWVILKLAWPYDAGMPFVESLTRFLILGFAGLGIYVGLAFLMRLPEPLKVYDAVMRRLHKGGNAGG